MIRWEGLASQTKWLEDMCTNAQQSHLLPHIFFLYVGSDDSLAMIWQLRGPGEPYGLKHILRGHHGDILDLAWSGDGGCLATCSIDNTVIVWNARKFPNVVTTLKGHADMVKGVTWDPVGKYLATQSTDRTLRVWRRSDWKEESRVSSPFDECGAITHVLRLAWSPDGKYIVSAHALNKGGPVAEIVQREDWKPGMDFVGHRKSIEVVRFNSSLFSKGGADNHGCVAMGGKDRSISVWLTSRQRPLLVMHDLFTNSVVDISWSQSGYELMACSLDGTVAYMKFSENELGKQLKGKEVEELFVKLYGVAAAATSVDGVGVIEDPELLSLTAVQPEKPVADVQEVSSSSKISTAVPFLSPVSSFSSQSSNQRTVINQMETRTKDGRRRITPMLVSQPRQPASPSNLHVQPLTSSSSQAQTQSASIMPPPMPPLSSPFRVPSNVQVDATSPGPKAGEVRLNVDAAVSSLTAAVIRPLVHSEDSSATTYGAGGVKRKQDEEKTQPSSKRTKRSKGAETSRQSTVLGHTPKAHMSKSSNVGPLLSTPEVLTSLSIQLRGMAEKNLLFQVDNQDTVAFLRCSDGSDTLWSVTLVEAAICLAGSQFIVATGGSKGSLQFFSAKTGRSLFPPFTLSALPVALVCRKHLVAVVTASCRAWLWDLREMKALVQSIIVAPLVVGMDTLSRLAVSEGGHVVVTLSSQSTHMYHPDMGTWVQLTNSNERCKFTSLLKGGGGGGDQTEGLGPLAALQQFSQPIMAAPKAMSSLQFLEHQIKRAELLNSADEYLNWMLTYISTLVSEGQEDRLREVCYSFINSFQKTFVGFSKAVLMDKLLPTIASNASLQRLYSELKQAVECM